MPWIAEMYMLCAGIGALFVTFSAAMGAAHGHGSGHAGGRGVAHTGGHGVAYTGGHGVAHTGGHGAAHTGSHGTTHTGSRGTAHTGSRGTAHTGSRGTAHTGSRGTAHTGSRGTTHTGSRGTAHTGNRGTAHTGSHGTAHHGDAAAAAEAANNSVVAAQPLQTTTVPIASKVDDKLSEILLTFCNPTLICVFVALFGSIGLILWRTTPLSIEGTVPFALLGALMGAKLLLAGLSALTERMFSSKTYTLESLLGCEAEVTVSIPKGKTGEIMYLVGQRRYTSSAKASDCNTTIKLGDHVVIVEMNDGIAYVETMDDGLSQFDRQLTAMDNGSAAAPPAGIIEETIKDDKAT